jgi:hypothetical protein
MVVMPDPAPVGDLAAAVSDALRGDRTGLNAIVGDARQRAEERARDAMMSRARDSKALPSVPAPVARPVPRPGPDREVEIRLRDGRRMRARISPAVARRTDLSAVARASAENNRRAFDALRRQRRAIERLRQAQDQLAKRLTSQEQQSDRALVGLVQGLNGLDRRVRDVAVQAHSVAVTTGAAAGSAPGPTRDGRPGARTPVARQLQRQQLRQIQETKQLALRAQIQSATTIVNSVQATAYGQRGSILATNNLLIAGTQLFWGLLGPVLQGAGVLNAASATVLAAVAPLGTLMTGEILLGDQQHVRFISGVTAVDNAGRAFVSLRGPVAEGLWPEFRKRTDVLVTARVVEPAALSTRQVAARVRQGVLEVRVQLSVGSSIRTLLTSVSLPGPVRVAWTVDTGADVG